jgi:hypothetical protein
MQGIGCRDRRPTISVTSKGGTLAYPDYSARKLVNAGRAWRFPLFHPSPSKSQGGANTSEAGQIPIISQIA